MPPRNKWQSFRTYFIAAVLCCIFIVCGGLFVRFMLQQNQLANIDYLYEAGEQSKLAISTQINGDFQTLDGVATCVANMPDATFDRLLPILKQINDKNQFIRMGLVDLEGRGNLLDINGQSYRNIDLSGQLFFQQALEGNKVLSNTMKDPITGEYINYYAIPIETADHTQGVLCAVNSSDVLRQIVDTSVFSSQGFSNIIDSTGAYVIRSANHDSTIADASKLEDLGTIGTNELGRIKRNLAEHKKSSFTFMNHENKKQLAVYVPIEINDWFVLATLPNDTMGRFYSATGAGMIALLIVASLIFLFFLYRIRSVTVKGQKALEYVAYTDLLTGCRSNTKFLLDVQDLLDANRREKEGLAIWYCDIKKFKYLNDLLGYQAGDQLLKDFAALIEKDSGENDLFCRISADNFAGLRNYHTTKEIDAWVQNLIDDLGSFQTKLASHFHLEISVGIYCLDPAEKELSVNDMINRANMAQKSVKQLSGSHYAFYNDKMRKAVRWENEIESMMERAMEEKEFKLYFQPKFNIQEEDRIAGAEILARWESKEKGMVYPSVFIPLFEKNGFIVRLDRFMFEGACQWLHAHLQAGRPLLNLAVNVSRLGLFQEDFVKCYTAVKEKYEIPDGVLELEFTESLILDDDELFRQTVLQLQENGFICSLDDFGSGYSSLNVLKNLPINVLKLDILFFHNGDDLNREQIVISNIVAMARMLHIKTIAEGVEEPAQVEFLRQTGCNLVQGYVFAKPMPLEKFDALLQQTKHYGVSQSKKKATERSLS